MPDRQPNRKPRTHRLPALLVCLLYPLWLPLDSNAATQVAEPTLEPPARLELMDQYSLLELARSHRDQKRWDLALNEFRTGLQRFPHDTNFAWGEVMVLAESGQIAMALKKGLALSGQGPRPQDGYRALSYVYHLNGDKLNALRYAQYAYQIDTNNPDVQRELIQALSSADLPLPALELARAHASHVPKALMRRLQADYAAELSRLALYRSRTPEERFQTADAALALYSQLMQAWQTEPDDDGQLLRIRIDRLQALQARARTDDVIREYEALRREGVAIPDYVDNEVASAYLAKRQPEMAVTLYQHPDSAGQAPTRNTDRIPLYYALQESENGPQANDALAQALATEPPWRRIRGLPQNLPNDAYLDIARTAAVAPLFDGDVERSVAQLQQLSDMAPRETGLKIALADALRMQGRPLAAEAQLKEAELVDPLTPDLIIAQGETALALQQWDQANDLLAYAASAYPEHPGTERLAREVQTHDKALLQLSTRHAISSDSPVSGSGDSATEATFYSAPMHQNWRAVLGLGYSDGQWNEGSLHQTWLRAGMQYQAQGQELNATVTAQHNDQDDRFGFEMSGSWRLDDAWSTGAQLAYRDTLTPLRALRNGITSNRAEVWLRWEPDSRRSWSVHAAPTRFSDGNTRIMAVISGRERLARSRNMQLDAEVDLSATHNTLQDTPYFNPRADFEVLPGLKLTHTLYRRYDTTLEQQFILRAGAYTQQGYGTRPVMAVGYGIRWQENPGVDVNLSALGVSRPYDGVREKELRLMLEVNLRF
jgi:biofilm PGA synthesis protein PgaA